MPISFDEYGNPQPYDEISITLDRFREIFTTIPIDSHREHLFFRFKNYLAKFNEIISPSKWFQFINGSYTTKKEMPKDIDVVNFVDPTSFSKLLNHQELLTSKEENAQDSKKVFFVDSYATPIFDEDDPRYNIYCDHLEYWLKWFGHDRVNRKKAIIKVKHNG